MVATYCERVIFICGDRATGSCFVVYIGGSPIVCLSPPMGTQRKCDREKIRSGRCTQINPERSQCRKVWMYEPG